MIVNIETVREQVAAAYISIARLRSNNPVLAEKIRDLQLAAEKVQQQFGEIFP